MNNVFYNITSGSLSWNPFIHFLHTIHITTPPPDSNRMTYSMFHILFIYNTARTEISTFLMSLHQLPEGCSFTLFTPAEWPSGFIIGQRTVTFPPTSASSSTPLGPLETTSPPPTAFHWPHGKFSPFLPLPIQSLEKWNIIIFEIALLQVDRTYCFLSQCWCFTPQRDLNTCWNYFFPQFIKFFIILWRRLKVYSIFQIMF